VGTKTVKSPEYNYIFNDETGFFLRWGKSLEDDPLYSPYGPEILDIEISTICSHGCSFCYKTNKSEGINMTYETFTSMFEKFPSNLTQIAFGIGDIDGNPDLYDIMDYCNLKKVIPNITINGTRMTPGHYDSLSQLCGAVAVSLYDYDTCYNAVKELTDRGMKQVNIHCLLAVETLEKCYQVLKDVKTDERLSGLNAVVFLILKPKGERNHFTQVKDKEEFKRLIDFALKAEVGFGFDSCTASSFLEAVSTEPNYDTYNLLSEPCESTLFSYYINVEGKGFPCSFTESVSPYNGIDILKVEDFMLEVWNHEETLSFRNKVLSNLDCRGCRMCPQYDLQMV